MSRRPKNRSRHRTRKTRTAAKRKMEEKWNRPHHPSPGTPDVVARFMADVGINAALPEAAFKDSLAARFGKRGHRFCKVWGGESTAVTAAQTASLDLALAVASQFSGARCEAYLSWLVETELPSPNRMIDVGCGIGIHTCFYAQHFPKAEVVGIDRCKASIACAKQLAAKLGIDNVRFDHADAVALPEHLAGQQFDLVTSTFVAHEVGDLLGKPRRSVEEVMCEPGCPGLTAYAAALSSLLADHTGTLITFEQFYHLFPLARWAHVLHDAGIGLDLSRGEVLSFVDYYSDPAIKMPLLLGSKDRGAAIDADEIRALWMEWTDCDKTYDLWNELAEAVFVALRPTDFVKGVRYTTGGTADEMRSEVWRHGRLALAYQYMSGERQLVIMSRHQVAKLIKKMDPRDDPDTPTLALVYYEEYDSPETADREPPCAGQRQKKET